MKTFWIVIAVAAGLFVALVAGAWFALRAALAPLPGEWSMPLAFGPLRVQAGVPSTIRLATSWWGAPLLQGRGFATSQGQLHLGRAEDGALLVRCAPCVLQPPGLGQEPLVLADVRLTVRRQFERLSGEVRSGNVVGTWQGELSPQRLRVRLDIPSTPLADGYALFAGAIPEVGRAQIAGRFSLGATFSLPSGTLTVAPRVEGFEVAGLGTEALVGARTACSRRTSKLVPESWLTRAVIAAEDQRFWEHPGFDLAELTSAVTRNQDPKRLERGASTLSQQVAKLLVTGDERSPARKLRELLYAVEMERTLGKARIARLYLDNAPWGEGLCGAESASWHYFGVRAHELGPVRSAWLAAMLHAPDREARRWDESGQIDVSRAQWVLLAMRGLPRGRKLELAEELPLHDWAPRWAEPNTTDADKGKPARL